jgi:hypothetical protein
MYPFGGPRFRDGPRKVQAEQVLTTEVKDKGMIIQVPVDIQVLQDSLGFERSHLHLHFRH